MTAFPAIHPVRRKTLRLTALLRLLLALLVPAAAQADPQALTAAALAPPVARVFAPAGLALGGHDAVAYFTESRAVPGNPAMALRWRGAVWRFASPANLAAFESNPTAYAPQFGGYCAYAMSQGMALSGDPTAFAVLDGRLYLAHNPEILRQLASDPARVIDMARRFWPELRR